MGCSISIECPLIDYKLIPEETKKLILEQIRKDISFNDDTIKIHTSYRVFINDRYHRVYTKPFIKDLLLSLNIYKSYIVTYDYDITYIQFINTPIAIGEPS